ncbi:DUF2637 domain-containing protein [Amycolatopsis japonica]|uniref:DUF2637 domain-containing protein n=1 Tax=Amycolatopsis japonica TaxID=208439 RepID=UPI0037ABE55C
MSAISLRIQCACTALVVLGAAYASYIHGRQFALRFGADTTTASVWPLIVDGLLTTATVELWKPSRDGSSQWPAWAAFIFGISLSLCANIASAPLTSTLGVAVAACPPLALLLAVELLNRALERHRTTTPETSTNTPPEQESSPSLEAHLPEASPKPPSTPEPTAEQRMWNFYISEQQRGRTPSGADLNRAAGTHNYGRRILRRWRTEGAPLLPESNDKNQPVQREATHPA